jgi:cobalt/nickel transport system permease protein
MMGVLGAFVFTAQMINFAIPFTGSSGHLGGGLLLAVLLGPHAAFLVISSVLMIQALFFLDGGLLALGCNMINLGFFPAFIAWPLLYRPLAGDGRSPLRAWTAAVVAAVVGLQLGAFSVVVQTRLSGLSDLPFGRFVLLMQPIHLAIGLAEGLVTAAVVAFVARARPEALYEASSSPAPSGLRPVLAGLLTAAVLTGGVLAWWASAHPDGLEWALARASGHEEVRGPATPLHTALGAMQEKTAFLPEYGFKTAGEPAPGLQKKGTSVSGLLGGSLTLLLAGGAGWILSGKGPRT